MLKDVKELLSVENVEDKDVNSKGVRFIWEYDEKRVGVRKLIKVEVI